jgi:ADP-ribose pyrophosphatase YjhB (NUDIX family)
MNKTKLSISEEFRPHITVATVVENNGLFLMVEEESGGEIVLNQPAGHLEPNESLIDCAKREVLEETRWEVEIVSLLGINLYHSKKNNVTYHRTTFVGKPIKEQVELSLDDGIVNAIWMSIEDIESLSKRHRSPMVMQSINDYLSQKHYPLSIFSKSD